MKKLWLLGVTIFIMAATVTTELRYGEALTTETVGELTYTLTNSQQVPIWFVITVMDAETFLPLEDELWRSSVSDDIVTLEPNTSKDVVVQIKRKGEFVICNTSETAEYVNICDYLSN